MGHYGGMHFIWWILGFIIFIYIFRKPFYSRYQKKQNPLDILKTRFANGELSKEKFEESKKIINADINLNP